MSQQSPVSVTLDQLGRVTDITVGGHSIAGAASDAQMAAGAAHRGDITTVSVVMEVDEVVTTAKPPEGWAPDDKQLGDWIRRNPEWFRDWVERYNRIAAMPLPIRRQDPK